MDEENLALPIELQSNVERYALYRCYSDQGVLLYVGQSGELGRRLARHAQKVWFLEVRGITLEWYADELSALNAEHRAIYVERPKYNLQSKTKPVNRERPKRRRKSRPLARGRLDTASATTAALLILKNEPDISGAQLGARVGRSERWGQLLKSELAADPEESELATVPADPEASA